MVIQYKNQKLVIQGDVRNNQCFHWLYFFFFIGHSGRANQKPGSESQNKFKILLALSHCYLDSLQLFTDRNPK